MKEWKERHEHMTAVHTTKSAGHDKGDTNRLDEGNFLKSVRKVSIANRGTIVFLF